MKIKNKIINPPALQTRKLIFLKKVVNTFLSPKIHGSFNKKNAFVANHDNTKPSKLVSFYHKLTHRLWFIPSMYSAKFWVDIKKDGKRGYTTFMKIDEKALFLIENLRKLINDKNMPILDVGCNIGRFLNVLAKDGCNNLTGIDINQIAINDSYSVYPALVDNAEMKCDTIQNFLSNAKENEFDLIYTMGATVEHVHPTFPLVKKLAKVSGKYVCLLINERELYVRFWEIEFRRNNFKLLLKAPFSYFDPTDEIKEVLYIFKKIS
tara:strand:- start:224 stop:1018 length:795 start_codon:yes stop_codon:yes gene_type:complete